MADVTIYTSSPCPYCARAKALLSAKGAKYDEIHIPWNDHEQRAALVARTGQQTVPQIFIGERFVGGYDQLAALDRSGELAELLTA